MGASHSSFDLAVIKEKNSAEKKKKILQMRATVNDKSGNDSNFD